MNPYRGKVPPGILEEIAQEYYLSVKARAILIAEDFFLSYKSSIKCSKVSPDVQTALMAKAKVMIRVMRAERAAMLHWLSITRSNLKATSGRAKGGRP